MLRFKVPPHSGILHRRLPKQELKEQVFTGASASARHGEMGRVVVVVLPGCMLHAMDASGRAEL